LGENIIRFCGRKNEVNIEIRKNRITFLKRWIKSTMVSFKNNKHYIIKICSSTATNAWHRRDLTSGPLVCACRKHTAVWLPWVNEFDVSTITTINPTVQFLEDLYPSQFYWFSPGQWPEKPRKNPSLSELVG
jgi:hypothetical protein